MPHRHPSLLAGPRPAPGRLWLTNARVFDGTGTGAAVREAAAVLVGDGVIERLGDAADPAPDGARVIDLAGRMLIAGLTNAHVHVQGNQPRAGHGAEPILAGTSAHFLQASLRDCLRMGVTTLRNVGSQDQQPQEARQAMRYGAFRGPRLLTCGLIISATAPGGRFYGAMYREADGRDEIRKAVREQLRAGADFVKVMTTGARSNELEDPDPTQLTDPEFAALVAEAHRMGVKIALGADRNGVSGDDVALELLRMVHHGLSVEQALIAATRTAAEALGLQELIGTIEPGKLADLVALDGDLLVQPELLLDRDRIWLVFQLGEPVAGAALEAPGIRRAVG
jgi:imidazolonepropionase-like amidohydrolase